MSIHPEKDVAYISCEFRALGCCVRHNFLAIIKETFYELNENLLPFIGHITITISYYIYLSLSLA